MPEVLLRRRAEEGACASSEAQICCLKGRFSGPCSWIMVAFCTAAGRVEGVLKSLMCWMASWRLEERYLGRVDEMYSLRSGRVS